MKSIIFKNISIRNFNSIECESIEFTPGKILVTGVNEDSRYSSSNGSGKSSIFEAIVYALYKKTERDDISRNGKGNTCITLEFDVNDVNYKVERYHKHTEEKSNIFLYESGVDISERIPSLTDNKIQELVGIDYQIFICTIVVLQGLPISFNNMSPTIRKQMVEYLLGFSDWKDIEGKFKKKKSALMTKKESLLEGINDLLGLFEKKKERLSNIARADQIRSEIDSNKSILAATANKKEKLQSKFDLEQYQQTSRVLDQLYVDLSKYSHELTKYEKSLKDKKCFVCNQTYSSDMLKEASEKINTLSKEIESGKKLLNEQTNIKDSLDKIKSKISSYGEREGVLKKLISQASDMLEGLPDKEVLEREVKDLEAKKEQFDAEKQSIATDFDNADYILSLLKPSSEFRSKCLSVYLDYINSIINSITDSIFDGLVVRVVLSSRNTGLDIYLEKDGRQSSYASLSGGEKRRVDLIIVLSFQRFLLDNSGITTNLLVFDEIFDGLDDTGVFQILSAIDMIFDNNKSLYVITHNATIKSNFSKSLQVVKRQGVTTVDEGVTI